MSSEYKDLKGIILAKRNSLPNKQKYLCDYILKEFENLGLITIKELSSDAQVGISTVMRTIKSLGYDNFNDFRRDIYNQALPNDSEWVLHTSFMESEQLKTLTIPKVWDRSVDLLNGSLKEDLVKNFDLAVDYMFKARSINILGTRPYKASALYLEQLLNEFYLNIRQLGHDTETMFDKIIQFNSDDVVFVFAFEPYTTAVTNAVKEAYYRNCSIIVVTDYDSAEIVEYASVVLKLSVSKNHFSILPVIALIDAIVLELGKKSAPESLTKLKELERALKRNNITD